MLYFKRLSAVLLSGIAIILAGIFPIKSSLAESPSHPKTVQVKPGGASIFAQPKSSGEVIGEYNAGVILNPTLRVFSNEGQIWLKIGDHWVPDASLQVLEGSATPSASIDTPIAAPPPSNAASSPSADTAPPSPADTASPPSADTASPSPADTASPSPEGKPLDAPTVKEPKMAIVTAEDPDIAINVRAQPSTESDAVLAVKPGDQAEVLQQMQGEDSYTWYKLKFIKLGAEGWMRGDFVQVQSAKALPEPITSPSQPENSGS